MSLYDNLKNVAKVARQIDNIELYSQLIDLSAQALELQNEVVRLTEENRELKKQHDLESRIERHRGLFITLKGDELMYCSRCWDSGKLLIQVKKNERNGRFKCPFCNAVETYDEDLYAKSDAGVSVITPQRNSRRY